MDGATVADSAVFGFDTDWSIAALGDVDGDGTDDILWRSTSTGALGIWFITDGALHGTAVTRRRPRIGISSAPET